jgi:hypothetical protein
MHHVRARGRAIRAIDAHGGTYGVHVVGPKWLQALVGDEKCFYDASRVSFGPSNQGYDPARPFTDEAFAEMVPHLNQFDYFQSLYIWDEAFTDKGVSYIKDLRIIRRLDLSNTSITDHCVPEIAQLQTLQELGVNGTAITSDGLSRLRSALPNCRIK